MGGGRGGQAPPHWILKLLAKKPFFQFQGVKNKFYHFWPLPVKTFGKISHLPTPGKILPTSMHANFGSVVIG